MDISCKIGETIGHRYEVIDTLGGGNFGIVCLVYCQDTDSVYALKTFQDRYLNDRSIRESFLKEAQIWINLGRHPYLVRAFFVDVISGRHYLAMEYIAEDTLGRNSLEDYLKHRPPDLIQSLRWAIQFCHGMEHAYSKGIRCHRDIRPSNILISQDKAVKISDFGLGDLQCVADETNLDLIDGGQAEFTRKTQNKVPGYLAHMPPERWIDRTLCDQAGDVYSFGMTLFQMATGGQLPFERGNYIECERFHKFGTVPELSTPLFPIIQRCLKKEPTARYQTFNDIRQDLEIILVELTGEIITPPEPDEMDEWEWLNKGSSLASIRHYEEALKCYKNAIAINPRNAPALGGKGLILSLLGYFREAICYYDRALEIAPDDVLLWLNKGHSLGVVGQEKEAIYCCDKAIEIDPFEPMAWSNKAARLSDLGRHEEAFDCCERALQLDPVLYNAWINKGDILRKMNRLADSVGCFEKAIQINPLDKEGFYYKGLALCLQKRFEEANVCYDMVLAIDPTHIRTLINKGVALWNLGHSKEAIDCSNKVIKINPREAYAWQNKGAVLMSLGKRNEALRCFL